MDERWPIYITHSLRAGRDGEAGGFMNELGRRARVWVVRITWNAKGRITTIYKKGDLGSPINNGTCQRSWRDTNCNRLQFVPLSRLPLLRSERAAQGSVSAKLSSGSRVFYSHPTSYRYLMKDQLLTYHRVPLFLCCQSWNWSPIAGGALVSPSRDCRVPRRMMAVATLLRNRS